MDDNTGGEDDKLDLAGLVKPVASYNEYGWGFCPAVGATRRDQASDRAARILAAIDLDAIAALVGAASAMVANLDEGDFISTTRIDNLRTALARLGGGE